MKRSELVLPDLGFGQRPVTAGMWLVRRGSRVTEGMPLLEVLAGGAVIDLPSPAEGVLVHKLVAESESLTAGQRLAIIESDEDELTE